MSVSTSGISIDIYDVSCSGAQWLDPDLSPSGAETWLNTIKSAISGIADLSFDGVEIYQKYDDQLPSS